MSHTEPLMYSQSADQSMLKQPSSHEEHYDLPTIQYSSSLWDNFTAVLLTIFACMGSLLFGWHIAFSSPTQDSVQHDGHLSKNQANLMFSLISIGAMFGALVAGKVADGVGRRGAIILGTVPFTAGALVFTFWVTYAGLIIGRTVAGFAVGYSSVMVPLYIAEIAPPPLRGLLGCVNQLCIAGGVFLVNLVGLPTISHPHYWKTMMLMTLGFVAIQLFGMLTMGVETPSWLVNKGRVEDAEQSLIKLRGPNAQIKAELAELQAVRARRSGVEKTLGEQLASLSEPRNYKPFLVGLLVVVLQQWSGVNAFVFNTKKLFEGDKKSDQNSNHGAAAALHGAIIVNAVQTIFTGISAVMMDKAGRRFFLLLSAGGIAVTCGAMGFIYRYDASQSLKIGVVVLYFILFAVGLGPVPWLIASEIFPEDTRGLLVSLATVMNWLSAFAITLSFSSMQDSLGDDGTFWVYGGISFFGAILVYIFVPETKGKTLDQIQQLFKLGGDHAHAEIEKETLI